MRYFKFCALYMQPAATQAAHLLLLGVSTTLLPLRNSLPLSAAAKLGGVMAVGAKFIETAGIRAPLQLQYCKQTTETGVAGLTRPQ